MDHSTYSIFCDEENKHMSLELSSKSHRELLSSSYLERVESWGMSIYAASYVYRPSCITDLKNIFKLAKETGRSVALRGAGCSYGDASLNSENITLDLTRFNRILDWDPYSGIIAVEPGVTLEQLWKKVIGDGWWPPVVSGTMYVTMGGAVGMNYHGKNNFKLGPIGEHVLEFDILLPTGETITCTRKNETDLFYSAIGGFGMLGCFTRIVLQMHPVETGQVEVTAFATDSFQHIYEEFEQRAEAADYLVGWIDCFAAGSQLGRGQVHAARYLSAHEVYLPEQTLRIENQDLPDTLFGIVPKSIMWRFMKLAANPLGMRIINSSKYALGRTIGNNKTMNQSLTGFSFLLDYMPGWKRVYSPGGLIQYQSFIPNENAVKCFEQQLMICQKRGIVPWLGVFKKHRKDDFLMSHAVDGYSLALDFPVNDSNREQLKSLTDELNSLVIQSHGRFYFAKDCTLTKDIAAKFLGEKTLRCFARLKKKCDPQNILQTDLSRRLFGDWTQFADDLTGSRI